MSPWKGTVAVATHTAVGPHVAVFEQVTASGGSVPMTEMRAVLLETIPVAVSTRALTS
jgi:hypothetical protein